MNITYRTIKNVYDKDVLVKTEYYNSDLEKEVYYDTNLNIREVNYIKYAYNFPDWTAKYHKIIIINYKGLIKKKSIYSNHNNYMLLLREDRWKLNQPHVDEYNIKYEVKRRLMNDVCAKIYKKSGYIMYKTLDGINMFDTRNLEQHYRKLIKACLILREKIYSYTLGDKNVAWIIMTHFIANDIKRDKQYEFIVEPL